jgi:hypothetical protein
MREVAAFYFGLFGGLVLTAAAASLVLRLLR